MNHSFIDEHSHIESPLSRIDPRAKVVGFLALVTCIALTGRHSFAAFALYGALVAAVVFLSRIPVMHVIKRALVIAPFILAMAAFLPFTGGGDILFGLGPLSVSRAGLLAFCAFTAKSFLSVVSLIILTAGTPFTSLLKAFQDLRVPSVVIMVLSFMYRYFFIIEDEFMRMKQARESRSAGHSGRLRFRSAASMVGVLFVRAYERSEAVYMAMCSRGFTGQVINGHGHFHLHYHDVAFLVLMALSLTGIQWLAVNG